MNFNFIKYFLFLFFFLSCQSKAPYPVSDHSDGYGFFNPSPSKEKLNFGLGAFLKWKFNSEKIPWPDWRENNYPLNIDLIFNVPQGKIHATFIGHATFLIGLKGLNILTDPIFSKTAGLYSKIGPSRHRAPSLTIDELPKIDIVYISHSHYDHMDQNSISTLSEKFNPLFIVPLGNKKKMIDLGASSDKIIELDWWQTYNFTGNSTSDNLVMTKLTVVPSQHWSKRTLFDTNKALWGGIVIEHDKFKIYFSGDTGLGPFAQKIFEQFGSMDLSIIPIGAYNPRWFMKHHHTNPEDAVIIHQILRSKMSLGCHFGTFQLTDEGIDDPLSDLAKAKEKFSLRDNEFKALDFGETHVISND
jgi:L-ascorbate metabolism protein UlaG (beta-lactamase superfamily)